MKRFAAVLTIFLSLGGVVFGVSSIVHAQSSVMTEAHIERIRANCVDAQSQLMQLHATDALLRVNRGQLYEQISTRLMSPFNSRVVLNKFDGTTLVSITSTYDQQLDEFRSDYQQYEEAMSALLRINCMDEPVTFYDGVADTRAKRQKVHESTVKLQQSIKAYQAEFDTFRKKFIEGKV